ncbi:MAG: HAD-IB family phosphatase [Verrucomicrobiales bacterium]|nr:HAD-IB family phosphatase [Verrucomicrobiales bacterium]
MRIALFDLDHTLLPHDTQTLFCNYVLKRHRWRTLLHGIFVPFALARAIKLVPTSLAKRAFHSYLWGMPRARLDALAREFARESVDGWVYPELRAELMRHRHQGRTLILNTASPAFYARPIAEVLGFDHCIATPVNPGSQMPLLPPIDGENNKRQVKIDVMERQLPALLQRTPADRADSWGYSDSAADIPLLDYCGHHLLIHPSRSLTAHYATTPCTTVLKPRRPYRTKVGDMLAAARQMLGLYRVRPRR